MSETKTLELTDREKNVLSLVAYGIGNKAIGERLYIAESTVNAHLRSAMLKTGTRNKVAAMVIALQQGEIDINVIAGSVKGTR